MQVSYRTKKLEKECEQAQVAVRAYGERVAQALHQRIDQLRAADSVEMLIQYRIGRCHSLKGDRDGQYAMDLGHPMRLVFEKVSASHVEVRIVEIEDYH